MIEQQTIFLEVVFQSMDFNFESRDEIEDPLEEALQNAGLGEVTGAGSGAGIINIDIEVNDFENGLGLIRHVLRVLGVAASTVINQYHPNKVVHSVYDE